MFVLVYYFKSKTTSIIRENKEMQSKNVGDEVSIDYGKEKFKAKVVMKHRESRKFFRISIFVVTYF